MTGRQAVMLVAWREIEQRVRSNAFVLSTLAIVVGVVAAAVIPSLSGNEGDKLKVGLVGQTPAPLVGALTAGAKATGAQLDSRRYLTRASGERALRDDDVGVLVVDGSGLVWKSEPDDRLRAVASGALQQLQWRQRAAALGLTFAQARALLTPQPIPQRQLEPTDPNADVRYAAALAGVLVLMLTLTLYGNAVASGVAQEKGSRVMEVLLSRVTARELLTGKVIGIGLVGLSQLLLAMLASLAAVLVIDEIQIPSAVPSVIGWVILWFDPRLRLLQRSLCRNRRARLPR